jgi:microcystin degradation protein MlrC
VTTPSPRVAILVLKQETATFSPVPTTRDDFEQADGAALDEALAGTATEYAGAADALRAGGAIIVPTTGAWALSGGPVADDDLEQLLRSVIAGVERALPVDGVLLVLHGAMAAPGTGDPEGRLLDAVRARVGAVPIVATLDLHAVLTDAMVGAADVLVPFHTYPHTDQYETGQRAARVLLELVARPLATHRHVFRLPILARGDELLTAGGLFGVAVDRCRRLERRSDVLSAAVLIGNPFTDVPELASNVLVTTTTVPSPAVAEGRDVARYLWEHRERFRAELLGVGEALRLAEAHPGRTVLSDGADATGSGAPGDSNQILVHLLDRRLGRSALVPIVDAAAARRAHDLGVGATASFRLGGSLDRVRHVPVEVDATVVSLGAGEFRYEDGTVGRAGRTAVLRSGTVTIMVTERAVWVVGQEVFRGNGVEPSEFDIVVVKSPNGYRQHYGSRGVQLLAVDVPGCTTANLVGLPYARCRRPIWPLDDPPRPDYLTAPG